MANFQFGFDNASFGFRGRGDGKEEVDTIKLKCRLGFVMPCMLRVEIVRETEGFGARGV